MSPPLDLSRCRNLLFVKPSSFGDIVHALPSLESLARAYPHLRIHWVANTEWVPLLEGNPALSSVIPFPRSRLRGAASAPGFLRWTRALRQSGSWDAALDLQGLLRSAFIAVGSAAPVRIGASNAREGARLFYNRIIRVHPSAHAVHRYLEVVRGLGAQPAHPSSNPWLPSGDPLPPDLSEPTPPFVLFHPFSRGDGKSLTLPQVTRFCAALHEARLPVVLAGALSQDSSIPDLPGNTCNLINHTTIPQLIRLLRRSSAVVSVDSGPMHLAAALGLPLLGIHTWSDPRQVGPCRDSALVWRGGCIRPVGDLPPPAVPLACTPLADPDIDAIAAWAIDTAPSPIP
ncbi:MAG TPA: glycosyltransferase family 9 protein [Verrucomicrobiales bacterium]|nr:glycosyltransferase family 9 protein [Verrucomicrobiales bacterium]